MGIYSDPSCGLLFYHYGDPDAPAGAGKEVQLFYDIVDKSNAAGKPFEDPQFPPNESSLGDFPNFPPSWTIKWLRPKEVAQYKFPNSPPIFQGQLDQFGVNQGSVGDCWLLATMADVALKPDIMKALIPKDNVDVGFGPGVFHFRFWCRGKWVDICIDDTLPCIFTNGKFLETVFTKPTEKAGFWAPLVEKAYAKLVGQYSRIDLGFAGEAMADFSGGVVEQLDVASLGASKLAEKLKQVLKLDNIVAIGTKAIPPHLKKPRDPKNPGVGEGVSIEGMVGTHVYSILDIQDVQDKNDAKLVHTLVKCRNPWGNATEWIGAFSDSDPQGSWETVTQDLRTGNKSDGQFWIPIQDLYKYGDTLYDCRWSGAYRGDEQATLPDGLVSFADHGNYTAVNSGSRAGFNAGTYGGKPGYYAHLKAITPTSGEVKGDGLRYNCGVNITMMYKNYTRCGVDSTIPQFGYILLWAPGNLVPEKDGDFFYQVNYGVFGPGGSNEETLQQRQITKQLFLPEGTLLIVPWLNDATTEEVPYFFRIICEAEKVIKVEAAAAAE